MRYDYTVYHKTDEERIKAIKEDILSEYPRLGEVAELAAMLEEPFGPVHEDYWAFSNQSNHINRLIDIVIVTENRPEFREEYLKACSDLRSNYESWDYNFTYAGKERQPEYLIMKRFNEHLDNRRMPLLTMKQAEKILKTERENEDVIRNWQWEHTMKYEYTIYHKTDEERIEAVAKDILREYPRLGELARNAASLELPFGPEHEDYSQFTNQRNHINRLIDIVIVTENKPEFRLEHEKACRDLVANFKSWQENYTYANPEDQIEFKVMQRYFEHKRDNRFPLLTMKQALEIERINRQESGRRI
jgi:hypothetical protein